MPPVSEVGTALSSPAREILPLRPTTRVALETSCSRAGASNGSGCASRNRSQGTTIPIPWCGRSWLLHPGVDRRLGGVEIDEHLAVEELTPQRLVEPLDLARRRRRTRRSQTDA